MLLPHIREYRTAAHENRPEIRIDDQIPVVFGECFKIHGRKQGPTRIVDEDVDFAEDA